MVGKAIVGDAKGLAWIVERFGPLLQAQARYRLRGALRDVCDPDDLVNDVWLICLPKLEGLRPRDGRHTPVLVKFLATTLLNRSNTLVRDYLTRRPLRPQGTPECEFPDQLPARSAGAVTRAMRAEQSSHAVEALQRLSETDREIVVLRAIERIPNHVAALHLGIQPNTAAVRFRRAMARLRDLVSESVFDELDYDRT